VGGREFGDKGFRRVGWLCERKFLQGGRMSRCSRGEENDVRKELQLWGVGEEVSSKE